VDRNLTVTDAIAAREQATGQKAERGRGENEKAIYILVSFLQYAYLKKLTFRPIAKKTKTENAKAYLSL
jgi:hypothetical protein